MQCRELCWIYIYIVGKIYNFPERNILFNQSTNWISRNIFPPPKFLFVDSKQPHYMLFMLVTVVVGCSRSTGQSAGFIAENQYITSFLKILFLYFYMTKKFIFILFFNYSLTLNSNFLYCDWIQTREQPAFYCCPSSWQDVSKAITSHLYIKMYSFRAFLFQI